MVLVAVAAPGAQAWDRPLRIGFGAGTTPRVDTHGTTRWLGNDRRSALMASVRSGSRRIRRCHVPPFDATGLDYSWTTNPAGAMAFSWDPDTANGRVKLISARPGHCFGRPIALGRRKAPTRRGSVLLGPLGTVLATWTEGADDKSHRVLATGPLGRKPVRRRFPGPPRRGFDPGGGSPAFIDGDRIAWTWFTIKTLDPDVPSYLEQLWGAIGDRKARGFGRFLKLASVVSGPDEPHSMQGARVLTDRSGDQVMGWLDGGSFFLRSRRHGRPFGRVRSWSAHGAIALEAASNRAGDAVFAWDDDGEVYALVRRRNGRVVGPQLVSTADPPVAEYPSIAIDGSGRAIVTFTAQFAQPSQIGVDEVQVATSGRDGRFGAPVTVSGPKRRLFDFPLVAVNARGRTALIYERDDRDDSGNLLRTEVFLIRGRLGR